MTILRCLVLALIALVVACRPTTNIYMPENPAAPSAAVVKSVIGFRVSGNASQVRIRYSTPADGLTQTTSSLPFAPTFTTTETTLLLSLEATPLVYPVTILSPFLSIQITVDGVLFREATSNDFTANTLTISGTWRR